MTAQEQIEAIMEGKLLACLIAPKDAHLVPYVINAYIIKRRDGILITTVDTLADDCTEG